MKSIPVISVLVLACVVLACLTMFMPVVAGAALPYASLAMSLTVCGICAVALVAHLVRR